MGVGLLHFMNSHSIVSGMMKHENYIIPFNNLLLSYIYIS
jgi:hypothetical protein